jgi:hypothetical protein
MLVSFFPPVFELLSAAAAMQKNAAAITSAGPVAVFIEFLLI